VSLGNWFSIVLRKFNALIFQGQNLLLYTSTTMLSKNLINQSPSDVISYHRRTDT